LQKWPLYLLESPLRANFLNLEKIILRHIPIDGVTFRRRQSQQTTPAAHKFHIPPDNAPSFCATCTTQINTTLSKPNERYCGHDPPRA
jgi:hypothetical protein